MSESKPLISVVVPMYNVAEDLPACLTSIVEQTYPNLEVILVDDGSTDECGTIAQEYADQYDYIQYHRIENQGLGHARNYGATFATGEWIIFPDSDDILEDYALEEMLALGLKHDVDIVLGDVIRFNTTREFPSWLHRRAFEDMPEVGHITKNHNLLYDTTAWNKLFRKEFYDREGFRWAEGMLYEDIPVTVPAHFKARAVAFLDKVVYRWRARDGSRVSITQSRTDTENFYDRLKAMQAVDEFFKANVDDPELLAEKDYKHLHLDLKLYVDEFEGAPREFVEEVGGVIARYLEDVDPRALERLIAIDRVKYHFIAQKDWDSLVDARKYQRSGIATLRVYEKDGRFYGRFPWPDLPNRVCDMTEELREGLNTYIERVSFANDTFLVQTTALVEQLTQLHPKVQAHLVDEEGERVREFAVSAIRAPKPFAINFSGERRAANLKLQPVRDYELRLPLSELEDLPSGSYGVEIEYTNGDLVCEPKLVSDPKAGSDPRPVAVRRKDSVLSVDYNTSWQLQLKVDDDVRWVQDVTLDSDAFELSLEDGQSERVEIPADEFESREPISVEGVAYARPRANYYLRTLDYNPYAYVNDTLDVDESSWTDVVSSERSAEGAEQVEQLWSTSGDREGTLVLQRLAASCVLKHISEGDTAFSLYLEFPYSRKLSYGRIKLVGKWYGAETLGEWVEPSTVGNQQAFVVPLNFSDERFVTPLRNDRYTVLFEARTADGQTISCDVFSNEISADAIDELVCDGYTYTLDRRGASTDPVTLLVERDRKFYETGKLRKEIAVSRVYPGLRKLPIKKNLVLFESFWGKSAGCSPKALYNYITEHYPEYECVWSVNDPRIPVAEGAKVVVKGTLPYFDALARAHYLVNNVNFPDYYEKRPGQIEIQTMHGTPLKTMGLDVPAELPNEEAVEKFLRRCDRWDYLVVQGTFMEEVAVSAYDFKKEYLKTGYPRNDEIMRKGTPEVQAEMKRKLGIDPDKKFVLYVPTWRSMKRFDMVLDMRLLEEELGEECVFGFRRHYLAVPGFTHKALAGEALDFTYHNSLDDLLLAADVVITDYSSIMFDYGLLKRPMVFFTYDLEAYRDELRGFYFDLTEEAPGPLVRTTEEVLGALKDILSGEGEWKDKLDRFLDRFLTYETDHSSKDVFDRVFDPANDLRGPLG